MVLEADGGFRGVPHAHPHVPTKNFPDGPEPPLTRASSSAAQCFWTFVRAESNEQHRYANSFGVLS